MSDKVEISKVCFKIGDKTIDLTLDEAKKLQELLNSNFGQRYVPQNVPIIIEKAVPYYPDPYRWKEWKITWTGNSPNQQIDDRSGGTLYCSC